MKPRLKRIATPPWSDAYRAGLDVWRVYFGEAFYYLGVTRDGRGYWQELAVEVEFARLRLGHA